MKSVSVNLVFLKKTASKFFILLAIEIRFPRFRGKSYLALPTLRDAHKSMEITINFKPEYYEGILLYSGEKQNLEGDFVAIILNQGFVEFRFESSFLFCYSHFIIF